MAGNATNPQETDYRAKPDAYYTNARTDYVALLPPEERARLGRSLRIEPVGVAS